MKKLIAFTLVLACTLGLSGCRNTKEETYSFRGEHEYFTITHGEIVVGGKEEVFAGGALESYLSDLFKNAVSYSTTFYTLRNEEKHIILSNSVEDNTGGTISVDADLGRISGDGIITNVVDSMDNLSENLWFELKITDSSGEENTYQLQLTMTK